MTYTDQTRTCRDCGNTFTWTAGEQEFYASRGLTNPPSRCPDCRQSRKTSGGGGGGAYGNRGGYSDRGPREMHEAVCASCGNVARVPFVPRGDRPVYCSDCYNRDRGPVGQY